MNRTITITELQNSGVNSWSVKDDSPRGITTKCTSEIKPGDEVVIDNHFTAVTEAVEPAQEAVEPAQSEASPVDYIRVAQQGRKREIMNKIKITQKQVKATHQYVISVGYCRLQSLLDCESPIAYTTRAEGWEADIYAFGNVAIVTGYAPFGNIRPSYEINQRYEEKAMKATEGIYSYQVKKAILTELINEYLQEVTQ